MATETAHLPTEVVLQAASRRLTEMPPLCLQSLPAELLLQIFYSADDFNTLAALGQTSQRLRCVLRKNAIGLFESAAEASLPPMTAAALRALALFRANDLPEDTSGVWNAMLQRLDAAQSQLCSPSEPVFRTIMTTGHLLRVTDVMLRRKLNHLYRELEHEHIADKSVPLFARRDLADYKARIACTALKPSPPDGTEIKLALRFAACAQIIKEGQQDRQYFWASTLRGVFADALGRALDQWVKSFDSLRQESSGLERRQCIHWRHLPPSASSTWPEEGTDGSRASMKLFIRYCCAGNSLTPANWHVMVRLGFNVWSQERLARELQMARSRDVQDLVMTESVSSAISDHDLSFTWRHVYEREIEFLKSRDGSRLGYQAALPTLCIADLLEFRA